MCTACLPATTSIPGQFSPSTRPRCSGSFAYVAYVSAVVSRSSVAFRRRRRRVRVFFGRSESCSLSAPRDHLPTRCVSVARVAVFVAAALLSCDDPRRHVWSCTAVVQGADAILIDDSLSRPGCIHVRFPLYACLCPTAVPAGVCCGPRYRAQPAYTSNL